MRTKWVGPALAVALGLAVVALWRARVPSQRQSASPPSVLADADAPPTDAAAEDGAGKAVDGPERDPLGDLEASAWSTVDLRALRQELPDNLYWAMAAPTKDAALIAWREEERARWNVEYGKVLSNTATAEEIDTYYAYRYQLSSDYVQLATYLLADHGDNLPKRDVALLKLAIEMNLARLEEIPRQIAEANERREAHEAVRRAWLADQQAFESDSPPPR